MIIPIDRKKEFKAKSKNLAKASQQTKQLMQSLGALPLAKNRFAAQIRINNLRQKAEAVGISEEQFDAYMKKAQENPDFNSLDLMEQFIMDFMADPK